MAIVKKRRAVGTKRKNIVTEIKKICPELSVQEAAAIALISSILGTIQVSSDNHVFVIKDGQLCAIGHRTRSL